MENNLPMPKVPKFKTQEEELAHWKSMAIQQYALKNKAYKALGPLMKAFNQAQKVLNNL